jgi:hypothetical protein
LFTPFISILLLTCIFLSLYLHHSLFKQHPSCVMYLSLIYSIACCTFIYLHPSIPAQTHSIHPPCHLQPPSPQITPVSSSPNCTSKQNQMPDSCSSGVRAWVQVHLLSLLHTLQYTSQIHGPNCYRIQTSKTNGSRSLPPRATSTSPE